MTALMSGAVGTELLRRAAAGDRAAYGQVVDATRSLVASIALAQTGDVPTSEELAQDVFLAAWQGLPSLRNPDSFLPWLRQLTRNHCAEYFRRWGSKRRRELRAEHADAVLATVCDPSATPAEALVSEQERAAVAEAIEQLPEEAREVVVLYYREGQSAAQVGRLLGLREAAVKKRLSRARQALREAVLSEGLAKSAPGVAFTSGVLALVTAGAPATAKAAELAGVARDGALAVKTASLLGAAGVGPAGGLLTLWLGARGELAKARDEEERSGVRRLFWGLAAVTVGTGFVMAHALDSSWLLSATWVAFATALGVGLVWWLPRVQARRRAAELREAPAVAAARHRKEAAVRWGGFAVGLVLGGAGLAYALRVMGAFGKG